MKNNRSILIPMAGAGSRFAEKGYKDPKPLITVSGKPMIVQAVDALPEGDNYVFICRKEHIEKANIDKVLLQSYPGAKFIAIDYLTEGQAATCLLAKDLISADDELVIGPCDNGMTWDKQAFEKEVNDPTIDAMVWTFRSNVTVNRNPRAYGWVKTGAENVAGNVSCKMPISENPINDHAVVGTFWFRRAGDFFTAAETMITKNIRVNNEFYVDVAVNQLIEQGKKVKIFEIDKYICWGTPDDLKTYQYWESFFAADKKPAPVSKE
jgi:dTDP-glucose pyrophosphorylase